jgi:hypothetical protein
MFFRLRPLLQAPAEDVHPAPGQPVDKAAPDARIAAMEKEVRALREEREELARESRTHHQRYQELLHKMQTTPAAPPPAAREDDEDDEEAPLDIADGELVDDLTKGRTDRLMRKAGGVTKAELNKIIARLDKKYETRAAEIADEKIGATRAEMTRAEQWNAIVDRFPDASVDNSPLFKETQKVLRMRGFNGADMGQLEAAIILAKDSLTARGITVATGEENRRDQRDRAIGAQSGDRGFRGGNDLTDEDENELSDEQELNRQVLNRTLPPELQITKERALARLKMGVNFGGRTNVAIQQFDKMNKGRR